MQWGELGDTQRCRRHPLTALDLKMKDLRPNSLYSITRSIDLESGIEKENFAALRRRAINNSDNDATRSPILEYSVYLYTSYPIEQGRWPDSARSIATLWKEDCVFTIELRRKVSIPTHRLPFSYERQSKNFSSSLRSFRRGQKFHN